MSLKIRTNTNFKMGYITITPCPATTGIKRDTNQKCSRKGYGNTMKKFLSIILILVLACSLFGCMNKNALTESTTQKPETTDSLTVKVTFPEGYTALEIAQKLEKNNVCSVSDFMKAAQSEELAKEYGFFSNMKDTEDRAFLLEGYIFPDTYEFYKGESAENAISRFLSNTKSKLTEKMSKRAKELGYSLDEIITLASVIQAEAGDPKEMGKVSSVLHNRIESPDYGKLQCDVTINYVNENILVSPYVEGYKAGYTEYYNTYKKSGLPVGAICNPGLDAINAALYPEDTDYFYFVTDKDWNYYYASTYEEHLKNCKKCGIEF